MHFGAFNVPRSGRPPHFARVNKSALYCFFSRNACRRNEAQARRPFGR